MRPLTASGAVALALLVACHKSSDRAGPAADAAPTITSAAAADAALPPTGPRCRLEGGQGLLGAGADSVVVGEVASTKAGLAVGLLRSVGAHSSQAIAVLPEDLSATRLVEIGAAAGDTPPPRPFVLGASLFAAAYAAKARDAAVAGRTLGLYHVEGDRASPVATIEQGADESNGMDVAGGARGGLVAWDEDAPSHDRGVIKVATFDGGHVGEARVITSDASDAEEPQVAARAGGFWVAWFAHRPLVRADAAPPDELEGPAEAREARWIEVLAVDDAGKASGPVRRVTAGAAHVSAFVLLARGQDKPANDALDVFMHDDEERSEGAGGRILRVTVHVDSMETVAVLVPDGAGRGAPVVARLDGQWLAYADTAERTWSLPIAAPGQASTPSLEPTLDAARILGAARTPPVLYAVFPTEKSPGGLAPVRAFRCARGRPL